MTRTDEGRPGGGAGVAGTGADRGTGPKAAPARCRPSGSRRGRLAGSIPAVLAAAAGLVVVAGCGESEATETDGAIQGAPVELGALRIVAEATGTVEPIRQVEVKSKASGEILELHVDVGDQVEAGTLLARVDPRDVRNAFDQAEADLQVAQARVDISRAQLDRSEQLLESGVITRQEYENANLEYANAQAVLVKAVTNQELAELRLGDVTILAPMAGTILQKSVEEGQVIQSASQNVSGGTTLFVMANLQEMQVRTLVDETDMGDIRARMTADVQVEAFPDRTFAGTVEKVEPQAVVQQNVTMFPVIVRLDNREGLLRPGMNAEVGVLIDEASDILLVPNNAIVMPQDVGPAALVLGLDPEALDLAALGGRGPGGRGPGAGPAALAGGGRAARGARGGAGGAGPSADGGTPPAGERTASGPGQGNGDPAANGDRAAANGNGDAAAAVGGLRAGRGGGAGGGPAAMPADGPGRALFDSLRAQVERGEISQDSARSAMVAMRQRMGGPGGGPGTGPGRGMGLDAPSPGSAAGVGEVGAYQRPREVRRAVVFVLNPQNVPEPRAITIGINDWNQTQVLSGLEEGERVALIGAAQIQAQQQQFRDRMRGNMGFFPGGGGRGR